MTDKTPQGNEEMNERFTHLFIALKAVKVAVKCGLVVNIEKVLE